ncbi:MAG: GDCCVxC domain-containing (seleno)protein [Balneolaceae bacterium]
MEIKHTSVITCPKCGESASETMPDDSCLFFRTCPACGETSKPRPGDCCVYCSFGSRSCPPVQKSQCC